jgi:hypothetical protein
MNKQPEALRLAAHAEANAFFGDMKLIAAELRRLHAVNAELLAALKHAAEHAYWTDIEQQLYAAIAKAEGEQT